MFQFVAVKMSWIGGEAHMPVPDIDMRSHWVWAGGWLSRMLNDLPNPSGIMTSSGSAMTAGCLSSIGQSAGEPTQLAACTAVAGPRAAPAPINTVAATTRPILKFIDMNVRVAGHPVQRPFGVGWYARPHRLRPLTRDGRQRAARVSVIKGPLKLLERLERTFDHRGL